MSEPTDAGQWLDNEGDVWHLQADGMLLTDSHPWSFSRGYVEKNWGPLVPIEGSEPTA